MKFKKQYTGMLIREYEYRSQINPGYSMRAFARDLGLNSPQLSMIFNGKQGLSPERAKSVAKKLKWPDGEQEHFCDLVAAANSRSQIGREQAAEKIHSRLTDIDQKRRVQEMEFHLIADWYHFAYLQLTRLVSFKPDVKWISTRLGLDIKTVRRLIQNLIQFGAIDMKTWKATGKTIITQDGTTTSHALRKHHKQMMSRALNSVDTQETDERHLSSLSVAIPRRLLPFLFSEISAFRSKLDLIIEEKSKGLERDEVYCFSSQFFRLTTRSMK